jgi:hypothetical protein
MKNIRKGVFETNSSSMHSVHIEKGQVPYKTIEPDSSGEIQVNSGEYGWNGDNLTTPLERAEYAFTYIQYDARSSDLKEMLKEVMEEHTGAKVVFEEPTKNKEDWQTDGYIDHQSTDKAAEVFESKQTLKDFIFGANSYVEIDNDNH